LSGGVAENLDFNGGVNPAEKHIDFRHYAIFDKVFAAIAALPSLSPSFEFLGPLVRRRSEVKVGEKRDAFSGQPVFEVSSPSMYR